MLDHCFIGFLRFPWILTFSVMRVAKCSGLNQTVAHSYKVLFGFWWWEILDCWTGYWPARSWHQGSSTARAAATWQPTPTPQPNVFTQTPSNQYLDILQGFLLLNSSAFVVPTSVSIVGMILTIKSSFWQTVGDIAGFSQFFSAVRRGTRK